MKQKLNSIILFLILFIGQVSYVKADTTIASGTISGTSIKWTVISPNGAQENLKLSFTGSGKIPDFYYSDSPWESYNSKITQVSIPSTITEIGDAAFDYCFGLQEINIPFCTKIGVSAFEGCTSLRKVNIASCTEIGKSAFENCFGLQEIEIPSCTKIGIAAFRGCTSLKEIYIPSCVESIGSQAFNGCSSLTSICYEGRCTANTSIEFFGVAANGKFLEKSGSGTSYADVPSGWTYSTHNGMTRSYVVDGTLYVKGNGAYTTSISSASWYSQRNSIKKIVVEEGVTDICDYAFKDCANVTEVTLKNTGTIGNAAFSGCTALTRVNIGTGLAGFKSASYEETYRPFYGCSKLSEVNVASLASFLKIECLSHLTSSYYSGGTAYEKTLMVNGVTHDSSSELVIPEGVTKISSVAFCYFKNVTKIKLPSTMTKIEYRNFEDHDYLTEITVPSTVTSVGDYAFWGCSALKTVTLNNTGVIGDGAFSNCTALTTVTLNNTGTIGNGAFRGCTALTRVKIGTGLIEFNAGSSSNSYPFYGCSNLSEVDVSSLASFCKITRLEYLTSSSFGTAEEKTLWVNGVTYSSSSELVIPEGVTSIPSVAFRNFKNVTKIKLPSTMTKIADYNFQYHNYLKKITLPSTITSIGAYAFYYCDNLKRIVCKATTPPATTSSIASYPSWISVKVPTGKTATYKATNVWKEFSIDEGRTLSYNVKMLPNESKQFTNDLLDYLNVKSGTTTNSSIASSTVSSNIVTIKAGNNPTYDGSTTLPYKSAVISLKLEDDDQLVYNVEVYPREAELTDGNAYKNTKEFEVDKVSYTRSFSEKIIGKWQCFYAPFDIEITDELLEDFDFAKLYMVSYKDENDNGEIEDGEPLKMMLNKLSAGKILHANKPYFVKTKSACTKTFVATNAVLKAAARGSVRCCTTEHEYSLVGIYNPTNIKGFYTMGTSGGFSYYTTDKTINQYRWYMEIKSLTEDGGEYENYARPIEIIIDGEDDTTGIVALENKASDSQNGKIYTLDGRQVTDFETLPSGIYIVNGKKVFKK